MLSLSELQTAPRKYARQVGVGSTLVFTGPCRIFTAHFLAPLLSSSPNPHGDIYNALTAAGDSIRVETGYAYAYVYLRSKPQQFPPQGLAFETGLTIQVAGGGTLTVTYMEE